MTVAELIEELMKLPQDSQVILQTDVEGNGYSPLSAVDGNAIYKPDTTWSGEAVSTDWSADVHTMSRKRNGSCSRTPTRVVAFCYQKTR
jgi:hypothetical protein